MLETRPDRSKTYGWIFVVVFFFVECRAPSVSRDRPLWRFIHRLIRPATTPFYAAIVYRRKSWCPIFRVRGRGWWRETFPFKRRQKKWLSFCHEATGHRGEESAVTCSITFRFFFGSRMEIQPVKRMKYPTTRVCRCHGGDDDDDDDVVFVFTLDRRRGPPRSTDALPWRH